MIPKPFLARGAFAFLFLIGSMLLPGVASAQTPLAITGGVQTYSSLTNYNVTMTGKSELRVTATTTPISSCTINLNSADAFFILTNIRPSVVVSTYLSQITVNGVAATTSNVRVVEYGYGTIVTPQSSSFQPLQVFSGPYFSGTSMQLNQFTYYNTTAALGAMNNAISSFKLKRGYAATFAANANGTGISQNFVAQDGDLEISVMPAGLQNTASFVRVYPWRWTGKKGWSGGVQMLVNPTWSYDWDNATASTRDAEYVPMRHDANWNAYSNINNKTDATHALGFNEPDSAEQANMTVDAAIAQWPSMLASGLRVGSPAVTDGGATWIYNFIDAAKAANLRVDYVAVHFYRGANSSAQLLSYLKAIHDYTGLPIWLTEFNNGANWTDSTEVPTLAANATKIGQFVDVMNSAPYVERYAVYNWVGATRMMVDDNGALTAAGVVYRDKPSPIAYLQAMPATVGRGIAQIPFESNAQDTSGFGNNGLAVGSPVYTTGHQGQAIQLDGATSYVQLPAKVATSSAFSFAAWVYWNGGADSQRIFDFGTDTTKFMYLSPGVGGKMRFGMHNGSAATINLDTPSALPTGSWQHVAVTVSGTTVKIYLNGVEQVSGTVSTPTLSASELNFLGKSQWPADPLFSGRFDDVRIADYAFTPAQVTKLMTDTPPVFTSTAISGGAATQGQAYSGSIAGTATDADAGDTITYSKASGPAWLQISAAGALSGTPTFTDEGTNEFTVTATDSAGATAFAVLTITLPNVLGNGTWTVASSGTWSDSTKWSGSFPANGAGNTADFSTLNIAADSTVTLDSSRAIGTLKFNDTSGAQGWTLASSTGATLTLDTGVTTVSPSIVVTKNTTTISASLAGTNGFTKSGVGTLILTGDNSLSGDVYIDTSSTTTAEGTVRLASPDALTNADGIFIRNNNAGSSTLELDGTLGNIATTAATTLSGRNGTVVAIRNLSGSNTLSGAFGLQSGGGNYLLQSDAGTLNLGGTISALVASARTLTFQGAGNASATGIIANGTGTISITKTGAGTLTLGGLNTFTGDLTINGGTVAGSAYAGAGTGGSSFGALAPAANRNITVNSGATLSLTGGNALGTGGSTNTLANVTLVVNAGGVVQTGLNGSGTGWWNKFGPITLNGGTIHVGSGANTGVYQGLALIGTVTVAGSAASTIDNFAASNTASNGIHLGQNATASQSITFNVGDATGSSVSDLTIAAKLLNTSANGTASGLTKSGLGTLTLAATNAYTGATTISAGALFVNGSISTGAVSVANGATLGGSGTIGGAVTVASGGTLSPGPVGTPGILSLGSLTLGGGSSLSLNLAGSATAEKVALSGTYTGPSSGTVALNVSTLSGFGAGTYPILTGATGVNAASFVVNGIPNGYTATPTVSGNTLSLVVTAWTAIQSWRYANFGTINTTGSAADTADPDGDGANNKLEYAVGRNPNVAQSADVGTLGTTVDGTQLTLAFNRIADPALTYEVLASDDMTSWNVIWTSTGAQNTAGPVTVTDNELISDHPTRFLRLRISP